MAMRHLALLAGFQPAASALLTQIAAEQSGPELGYWNISRSLGWAASGYRWEDLTANYSGPPEVAVACKQLYDPTVGKTSRSCNDTTFSYDVETDGDQTIVTVNQTVTLDIAGESTSVAITGTGVIEMQCGLGGAGESCAGSLRVDAEPAA